MPARQNGPLEPAPAGLEALPPGLLAVALAGQERHYRKGSILVEEGEAGGLLYFIVSGRLRAFSSNAAGDEFTFGHYGPGETIGELSLDGGPRSASVIAEEASVCRIVNRPLLEACIARDPGITFELMAKVIRMVRSLSLRARDLALNDSYGRLVALLRERSVAQADGTRWMPHRLTQAELAQEIGCSRSMVTRLLGELVRGGYLLQRERRWRVVKPLPDKF